MGNEREAVVGGKSRQDRTGSQRSRRRRPGSCHDEWRAWEGAHRWAQVPQPRVWQSERTLVNERGMQSWGTHRDKEWEWSVEGGAAAEERRALRCAARCQPALA